MTSQMLLSHFPFPLPSSFLVIVRSQLTCHFLQESCLISLGWDLILFYEHPQHSVHLSPRLGFESYQSRNCFLIIAVVPVPLHCRQLITALMAYTYIYLRTCLSLDLQPSKLALIVILDKQKKMNQSRANFFIVYFSLKTIISKVFRV